MSIDVKLAAVENICDLWLLKCQIVHLLWLNHVHVPSLYVVRNSTTLTWISSPLDSPIPYCNSKFKSNFIMIFFLIVNVFIESIVFKFYFKARNLKFCCVQYPNFFIYIYIYKGKRKRYLWEIVQLSKIFRFLVQSSPNHLIVYISTARLQQYI